MENANRFGGTLPVTRNGLLLLAQICSVLLLFGTTVAVARHLSPQDYGDFSSAYNLVAVAYIVCLLGADVTALRFVSVAYANNKFGDIKSYVRFVTRAVLVMTAILYLVTIILFIINKRFLQVSETHPAFVAIIFTPILAMTCFFYKALIGLSSPILSNVIYKVLLNLSLLWSILVIAFTVDEPSAKLLIAMFLAPWSIILAALTIVVFKRTNYLSTQVSRIPTRDWLIPGINAMPYSIALQVIANLGVVSVELFAHDEDSVGYFAAATWITQVFNSVFVSLSFTISLRKASIYVDRGEPKKLLALIYAHLRFVGIVGGIFICVIVFFGKKILELYGPTYGQSYPALILLALLQTIVVGCSLAGPISNYREKYSNTVIPSIALIILVLPVAYFLCGSFGITGVAVTLLLSVTVTFVPQQMVLMHSIKKDIKTVERSAQPISRG